MQSNLHNLQDLLPQLEKLLTQKRSHQFYADRLGITTDEVKDLIKELRNKDRQEDEIEEDSEDFFYFEQKVNNDRGTLESRAETDFEPKSDEELAELHKVDLSKYKISNYWSKLRPNGKFVSSILCTLIKVDNSLEKQKEILLEELKEQLSSPIRKLNIKDRKDINRLYAYEISIFDVHLGKMSWGEESGEDYDLKIAQDRYISAVENLLSLVNPSKLERIIFPIGNDMINIDSRRNETFAGTRQDSDSRFFKIIKTAKELLINTINSLATIAPVDVIVVAGNHDPESMFMLGEILEAYYHNNDNVNVDNSPKQRKYYQYGLSSFQYTHGNEETHKDLGLIFATEQPGLWAATKYRFCKLGHFHKNKKIDYVSVDEHQGFQIQVLPSLSGTDAWHNSKGYNSLKQAKGFLYHKQNGKVAEFTYSI